MIISSFDNKLIKKVASLKQKKYRDLYGEFLVEGLRSVRDILRINPKSVRYIFISLDQFDKTVDQLFSFCDSDFFDTEFKDERVIGVSNLLMDKICDTDSPQSIAAIVTKGPQKDIGRFCLYLDRIRDPGNLGTIVRTATAAGYSLLLDNCADIFSPKAVRSSMSGIMTADFCFVDKSKDVLSRLKSEGYTVFAADANGQNLYDFKKAVGQNTKGICIIIGNEANGIAPQLIEKCDALVSIPMDNIESLNAAVSAAILMYFFRYSL